MARRSTKSTKSAKVSKPAGPRRTSTYKAAGGAMRNLYARFSRPPGANIYISGNLSDPEYIAGMIVDSFPDYDIAVREQNGRDCVVVKGFPHQLITDIYTGESILSSDDISNLLRSINQTSVSLKELGHPNSLEAACEYKGITMRAYIDLTVMLESSRAHYGAKVDLAVEITKAPLIPHSNAKIKLGVLIQSEALNDWCYKASLVGDYTPEQKALAAQDLFRENAMFNKEIGAFIFDHYPKTLVVVGENLYD